MVTKRSFPFERREGMINTLGSTQLLNFCVFPPSLSSTVNEVVLEGCLDSNMSLVFVWEFKSDRRTESDEGQKTERS